MAVSDTFIIGDYVYTVLTEPDPNEEELEESYTVSARVEDNTQSSYSNIPIEVEYQSHTYSVVDLTSCFEGCEGLTSAPQLPESVVSLNSCFKDCIVLEVSPDLPSGVTDLTSCFEGCSSLTHAPQLPDSAETLNRTFFGCTNLVTFPETIPLLVINMESCFEECINLTTIIEEIPQSVQYIDRCFYGCISLQGDIVVKNEPVSYSYLFYGTENWIYIHPEGSVNYGDSIWSTICTRYSNVYYIVAKSEGEASSVASETVSTSFTGIKQGNTILNVAPIKNSINDLLIKVQGNTDDIALINEKLQPQTTSSDEPVTNTNIITLDADPLAPGQSSPSGTTYNGIESAVSNSFVCKAVRDDKESYVGKTEYILQPNGNAILNVFVQDRWVDAQGDPTDYQQIGMKFISNAKTKKRQFGFMGLGAGDFYKDIRVKPAYVGFKNSEFSLTTTSTTPDKKAASKVAYTDTVVKFTDVQKYTKPPRVFLQICPNQSLSQAQLEHFCKLQAVPVNVTKDQFTCRLFNPSKQALKVKIYWITIPNNSDPITWG